MVKRVVTGIKRNERTAMNEREFKNAKDYRQGRAEREENIRQGLEEVRPGWLQK